MFVIAAVTSVMFLKCVKSIWAVGGEASMPSSVAITVVRMMSSGELDDGESGGAQPVDLHVQRRAIDRESSGTVGDREDVDLVVRDPLHVVLARHHDADQSWPWLIRGDRLEQVAVGNKPPQLPQLAGDDPVGLLARDDGDALGTQLFFAAAAPYAHDAIVDNFGIDLRDLVAELLDPAELAGIGLEVDRARRCRDTRELELLCQERDLVGISGGDRVAWCSTRFRQHDGRQRSEEHTSELQSPVHLVCRLLLEKKKNTNYIRLTYNQRNLDTHRLP